MTPADRKAFIEVVVGFAELKGKQLSAPALELYWRSMRHWSLDDFRIAAEQLIGTCEFMPTPKDFEDLRKAERPSAAEAWIAVLECARRGCEPQLEGAGAKALRAIGGIRAVMMSDSSKTHFLEKRFCDHFETLQETDDTREALPYFSSAKKLEGPKSAKDILDATACAGRPTS